MSGHPYIGSDVDNKETLLDNQIPNQGLTQPYTTPLDINHPLQNNITPYNSTNIENKPINTVSQQGGLPLNNESPQTPSQYQNNKNISEIPLKYIQQIDSNTFYIPHFNDKCSKAFPIYMIIVGLIVVALYFFLSIYVNEFFLGSLLIVLFAGIILNLVGIIFLFTQYHSFYIILGPNSLKVVKKPLCGNKTIIYNTGELERFDCRYESRNRINSYGDSFYYYNYNLILVKTNGKEDKILSIGKNEKILGDMNYFLKYINNHIQTKIKMSELK